MILIREVVGGEGGEPILMPLRPTQIPHGLAKVKAKVKVLHRTRHESPKREQMYSSRLP